MKLLVILLAISLQSVWVCGFTTNPTQISDVYLALPQRFLWTPKAWHDWVVTPIKNLCTNLARWWNRSEMEADEFLVKFKKMFDKEVAELQDVLKRIKLAAASLGKSVAPCTRHIEEELETLSKDTMKDAEVCIAAQLKKVELTLNALDRKAKGLQNELDGLRAKLAECKGKGDVQQSKCATTLTRETDETIKALPKKIGKIGAEAEEIAKNFKPYYLPTCTIKLFGYLKVDLELKLDSLINCLNIMFPDVKNKAKIGTSGSPPTRAPASFLIVVTIIFVQIIIFFK